MQTKFSIFFMLLFFSILSNQIVAQEQPVKFKEFEILIERNNDQLILTNINGCGWKELKFDISFNKAQAIDEYGLTKLNKNALKKDPNLADFLFTILKIENGIYLKGLEGTAWIELSFTLDKFGKQIINHRGMVKTIKP